MSSSLKLQIKLHILLFCYIFSFYISAFPASMLIAAPLFLCVCADKKYLECFLKVWSNPFIFRSFCTLLFLIGFATLFPLIFMTEDFSLVILLITQVVHFVCATFFFAFLDYHKIPFNELCDAFINIFVLKTIIECVAFTNQSTVGAFVRHFNRFEADKLSGPGSNVRGFALSAATTYHLSLIYGVAFIIYIKRIIETNITVWKIIKGLFIFVGIFFAGRTGFVGVGIACLYFLFTLKCPARKKVKAIFKVGVIVAIIITAFLSFAPKKIRGMVVNSLIPYAFEAIYSKLDSGKAQTASTNQLKDMWNRDFNEMELVRGSGRYMDLTGEHYYMRVDPGVLRHLLYGGIIFYAVLIFYQLLMSFPFTKRRDYYIFILCFAYFFVMDFKGVTIGLNKFAFVSSLLFGYSYTKNYTEFPKCLTH